jgi:hypothetical protein
MPIWVYLAFSSIATRKTALFLIWACAIFSIYSIPWATFFTSQEGLVDVFLIRDWSWFAMMAPMTTWYWMSLRWVDRNLGWEKTDKVKG